MIDVNLVVEALYYLFPENEEEDRAYIERTLPILHKKLKLDEPAKHVRHRKWSYAMVAILVILGVLFLASAVAYAFGINVLNFFVYGTDEYWMIHIQPTGGTSISTLSHQGPSENYDVWGEAVADMMSELRMTPQLPKWISEGYDCISIDDTSMGGVYNEILAIYKDSNAHEYWLIVRSCDNTIYESALWAEVKDSQSSIEQIGNIEVIYSENNNSYSATWVSDNYFIRITGTCSLVTLQRMVRSITGGN